MALHRGLRELRGERLGCDQTDAHAAADGGHGYDLDVEVVARRARIDAAGRRERDVPRVHGHGDRAGGGLRGGHLSPAVERHAREPVGAGRRGAGEHHRAGEVGDERRARRRGQVAGSADLHDAPAVHHAHAVAEQRGLLEVVRHEERGHGGLVQDGGQLATGGRAGAGVERRQRLVEQQRFRTDGESARDGDPLALAARQRARPGVGPVGEPEAVEQRQRPLPAVAARHAPEPVRDVLPGAQVREQRVVLEHVAAAAVLGREAHAATGVEPHALAARHGPALGPDEPGHDPQHAALAGPGRAGQRQALPARDLQLDVEREAPQRRLSGDPQHPSLRRAWPSAGSPRTPQRARRTAPGRRRSRWRNARRSPAARSA